MFSPALQWGAIRLPTYATLLSLGLVGGVLLSAWQAGRRGLAPGVSSVQAFDAALLGAGGGLLGARGAYVALNWTYYKDHLSEALRLWAGGLAWQGGLLLGLLLVVAFAVRFRLPLGELLDVLAVGLVWFHLLVWLGSGAAWDIYGRETFPTDGLLWRLSAELPDLYGISAPRVNVALLGAVWGGLALIGVGWLALRPNEQRARRDSSAASPPGLLFLVSLGLIGLGGLIIVPLQANPVPYWFRLRLDWLFNLILTIDGLGGAIFFRLKLRERGQNPKAKDLPTD